MAALGQTQAQIPDRVQDIRQQSSLVVVARRVEFQAVCLHNVELQSSELVCRPGRFGCRDFRNAGMDMAAAIVAVAGVAPADSAVVVAVVAVVAGPALSDLRHDHPDRIASTFFVVFYQKTNQNGLKSFVLSEW